MADFNFNKDQLNQMIDSMSANLGGNSGALKDAVNNGSAETLLNNLKPEDAAKVQAILQNKSAAAKLLSTPQAQALLRKFIEGKQ